MFESISVDGYFCDQAGAMDWAHGAQDPELRAWVAGNARGNGTLLFGRKTYEMMAGFWPTPAAAAQMPEVAQHMNNATKLVASRTIAPTWQNTTRLDGDLLGAVRALKASPGAGITVLGSGSIAAQLGDAGLVDEYQFVIVPISLGAGRTLFASRRSLRLVEQRAFPCGNVVVTYASA
ncbi:dihydrofolate reductase family protein [soil metagenome]